MTLLTKLVLALGLLFPTLASTAQTFDPKLIIGRWRSTQDRNSELVFTKDKQIFYYQKKESTTYSYLVRHDSLITIDVKYADTLYYDIDNLSKQTLSLMYLARGNMLVYRRVQ